MLLGVAGRAGFGKTNPWCGRVNESRSHTALQLYRKPNVHILRLEGPLAKGLASLSISSSGSTTLSSRNAIGGSKGSCAGSCREVDVRELPGRSSELRTMELSPL
jgi:hypothetical protein